VSSDTSQLDLHEVAMMYWSRSAAQHFLPAQSAGTAHPTAEQNACVQGQSDRCVTQVVPNVCPQQAVPGPHDAS
jgi:hypothetical protein